MHQGQVDVSRCEWAASGRCAKGGSSNLNRPWHINSNPFLVWADFFWEKKPKLARLGQIKLQSPSLPLPGAPETLSSAWPFPSAVARTRWASFSVAASRFNAQQEPPLSQPCAGLPYLRSLADRDHHDSARWYAVRSVCSIARFLWPASFRLSSTVQAGKTPPG